MALFRHPSFSEYVMARLVTVAVLLFILFSLFLITATPDGEDGITPIVLLAVALIIFNVAIYRGAKRMQKELRLINDYLKNLDKVDKIDYRTRFFAQEFEDINQSLIKVLKGAKKREDIKQRYNAKLKLKNRQRADMISAIAHEFRNPIASIMGYSQTLHEDKDIPAELREKFLEKIYNNGNKIESLLSRLVLWNKFESGEATLHKSTFDIYILAQEVIRVLQEKYKTREIRLEGASFMVEADRTLMDIVLKNLIENALKYSQEEVVVRIENGTVSVTDKGVGIRTKDIDKVTKKFYRSGTHSWDNSMGLGLSIVKTILLLHGSKLEIKSKVNEGSTFSFKI
ncbi:sensor histidine kinase KdpD [Sulfurovum sp.]|uniref:sensor histidine kinase n=1 Tax=Sulfurovum sp. TaxID=1969726 RepID=UPI0025D1A6AA|nr:HAMP domain-containing sensor histidine kinase [Sulfurovum sp.]